LFDPQNVAIEIYEEVMEEVRTLIAELNLIIRARNYTEWVTHLAEAHYMEINSEPFLAARTEALFRRDQTVARNLGRNPALVQRRVLNSSRDFFEYIVVPARSNDRVDDIGFISRTRVVAFTIDGWGNRLILYTLEFINDNWRIVS
jgi:hypothetical protein